MSQILTMSSISAGILVGGLGTRLRSVVANRPKGLATVKDRPFLAYPLKQLEDAGIRHVVLCTGYLSEQVKETFGQKFGDLSIVYSQEPSPLSTAGALRLALPLFASETILVMNGDSFFDTDLNAFYAWHSEKKADASILLAHVPDTSRFGRVLTDEEGKILRFDEKDGRQISGWINAGIYLFKRNLLLEIPKDRPVSLEREMFPRWIGSPFYGYRGQGRFLDIGTPETYAMATSFFEKTTCP